MDRALGAGMLLAVLLMAATAAASARPDDDVLAGSGAGGGGIRQPASDGYRGRKVGARTEVRDVESDGEVQELGRFSVAEYNRQLRGDGGGRLEFGRVVAAQRQVVSGLKYYLRVAAVEEGAQNAGGERAFDAVVVVKPWLESRTLLTFAPAAAK